MASNLPKTLKKSELQDRASSLKLSVEGTVGELRERIINHLEKIQPSTASGSASGSASASVAAPVGATAAGVRSTSSVTSRASSPAPSASSGVSDCSYTTRRRETTNHSEVGSRLLSSAAGTRSGATSSSFNTSTPAVIITSENGAISRQNGNMIESRSIARQTASSAGGRSTAAGSPVADNQQHAKASRAVMRSSSKLRKQMVATNVDSESFWSAFRRRICSATYLVMFLIHIELLTYLQYKIEFLESISIVGFEIPCFLPDLRPVLTAGFWLPILPWAVLLIWLPGFISILLQAISSRQFALNLMTFIAIRNAFYYLPIWERYILAVRLYINPGVFTAINGACVLVIFYERQLNRKGRLERAGET